MPSDRCIGAEPRDPIVGKFACSAMADRRAPQPTRLHLSLLLALGGWHRSSSGYLGASRVRPDKQLNLPVHLRDLRTFSWRRPKDETKRSWVQSEERIVDV